MFDSLVEALQRCSGAAKRFVNHEAGHVGQQLRHDPRHHAPDRPRPRLFDLELIFQGGEDALDASAQAAAVPSPKRCFAFGGGFSASAQRIPERPAVLAKEICEPVPAVVRPRPILDGPLPETQTAELATRPQPQAYARPRAALQRSAMTLAGLSTKSQIAPCSDTSRCSRKPRKNCRFDGQ